MKDNCTHELRTSLFHSVRPVQGLKRKMYRTACPVCKTDVIVAREVLTETEYKSFFQVVFGKKKEKELAKAE